MSKEKSTHEDATSPPEPPREPPCKPAIAPVTVKIGEGRGNLEGREEWFRRRSGASR